MKKILALTSVLAMSGILYSCGSSGSSTTTEETLTSKGDVTSLYNSGLIDLLNSDFTKGLADDPKKIRDVVAKVVLSDNTTKYYDGYFLLENDHVYYVVPGLPTEGELQILLVNETIEQSAPTKGEITNINETKIQECTLAATPPVNLSDLAKNQTLAENLNITNVDLNTKSAMLPSDLMESIVKDPFLHENTTLAAINVNDVISDLKADNGDKVSILKTSSGLYLIDETNVTRSTSVNYVPNLIEVLDGKLYLVFKNGNQVSLNETNILYDNTTGKLSLQINNGPSATLNNNQTIKLIKDNDNYVIVGENNTLNVGDTASGSETKNAVATLGSVAVLNNNTFNVVEPILNATLAVDNSTSPMTANITLTLNNNLTLINDTVSTNQGATTNETLAQVNITTKLLDVVDSKIRALAVVSYNITAENDTDTDTTSKTVAFLLNIDPQDISQTEYANITLYNTNETLNATPAFIKAADDNNIYYVALNTTAGVELLKLDFENNTIQNVTANYNNTEKLVNLMENNGCEYANKDGEILCADGSNVYYFNAQNVNKTAPGKLLYIDTNNKIVFVDNSTAILKYNLSLDNMGYVNLPSGITILNEDINSIFGNQTNAATGTIKLYYYKVDSDNLALEPPVWYEYNITKYNLNVTSPNAIKLEEGSYLVNNTGYFYYIKVNN